MDGDMQAVMQLFTEEARELLASLEQALLVLESRAGDEELVRTLFREAHTLKGNAVSLRLPSITEAANALEEALEGLLERRLAATPALVGHMLRVVDVLHPLVEAALTGGGEMTAAQRHAVAELERLTAEDSAPRPRPTEAVAGPVASSEAVPLAGLLTPRHGRTLRLEVERLDRLLDLVGEITIARGRLTQVLSERAAAEPVAEEALDVLREADRLYLELQEQVMKARMVPVGPFFRQSLRTVRELAALRGKQARLELQGGEVEVDTAVVERLREVLVHLLRNAVDHGIESPEERVARGKEPCGRLVLRAFHDSGCIALELSDDGAGLRRDKLRERARQRGLVPERLSEQELLELIFEPGFSTAERVTELSGRGVGMDVVRRHVEALRGSISLESQEGQGTTFRLRLPLTLAIIQGFLVSSCEECYVLPLEAVVECVELPSSERNTRETSGLIDLRGTPVPYLRLRHLFGLEGPPAVRESAVILEYAGRRIGLVVDSLLGESQAVIKPLGRLFRGLPGISGSTILGNGRIALLLDVAALLREAGLRQAPPHASTAPAAA